MIAHPTPGQIENSLFSFFHDAIVTPPSVSETHKVVIDIVNIGMNFEKRINCGFVRLNSNGPKNGKGIANNAFRNMIWSTLAGSGKGNDVSTHPISELKAGGVECSTRFAGHQYTIDNPLIVKRHRQQAGRIG